MYICVCKAVSDKKIRQLVQEGATSMRELKQCLGVGSQCGKCIPAAQELLSDTLAQVAPVFGEAIPCTVISHHTVA
ncbi:MAG TPA: (2Fe-2S)-binding protein [Rheinheimera sp.]|nr:(2Fe-2S)-binding protein [Rheinheimera sp.]